MQYLAIKDAIEEQIESGMLKAGHKLPSERVLAEAFSTTRITLREALNHLALSGKIYREERRGWFISAARFCFNPKFDTDLSIILQAQKWLFSTRCLDEKRLLAPKEIADKLQLEPFSYVRQYTKLWLIEGRSAAIQYQYVAESEFSSIEKMDREENLVEYLQEHYLYKANRNRVEVGIAPATGFESSALHISSGSILLSVTQTAINNKESAYLLQELRICHDMVAVEID